MEGCKGITKGRLLWKFLWYFAQSKQITVGNWQPVIRLNSIDLLFANDGQAYICLTHPVRFPLRKKWRERESRGWVFGVAAGRYLYKYLPEHFSHLHYNVIRSGRKAISGRQHLRHLLDYLMTKMRKVFLFEIMMLLVESKSKIRFSLVSTYFHVHNSLS